MKLWERFVPYEIKQMFGVEMCDCCTAKIRKGATFCHHCGYKFVPDPIETCKHELVKPYPQDSLRDDPMEKCSHCHAVRTMDEMGWNPWEPHVKESKK